MKHPDEAALALHAGGDLGGFARWRMSRHLARCEDCRGEMAAFEDARGLLPEMAAVPEIRWTRAAARMKANIRLGLTLGELGGGEASRGSKPFGWGRPAAAFASVAALLIAGWVLQHHGPRAAGAEYVEVESTPHGIQVRQGGGTLGFYQASAAGVNYTPGAQGSMTAQDVDDSGYVTVTNVFAN